MKNRPYSSLRFAAASAALLLALPASSLAASISWSPTAGSTDASVGTNWTGGVAPVSGTDSLVFTSNTSSSSPTFNSPFTAKGASTLNFNGATSNFTISGSPLTINGGATGTATSNVILSDSATVNAQVINNAVVIANGTSSGAAVITFGSGAANSLTFNGTVNYGKTALSVVGTNSGTSLTFASLTGSGVFVNSSQGTVTIINASGMTGSVFINSNGGTTVLRSSLGTPGTFTLNGTNNNTLKLINSATITNTILTGNGGKTSIQVDTSDTATLNGAISGADRMLEKTGTGTLVLGGSNTYSGGTTLSAGTLQLTTDSGAGTGTITLGGTTDTTLRAGANSIIVDNAITLAPTAQSIQTISSGSFNNTFSDAISNDNANTTKLVLDTSNVLTLTGVISGSRPIEKTGTGILVTGATETFTGGLSITQGTLQINNSSFTGNNAVTLGAATLRTATETDQTFGSLSLNGNGTVDFSSGSGKISFAKSSTNDWGSKTLTISGNFVSGSSLRFGTDASGLTSAQLRQLKIAGFNTFSLSGTGFLVGSSVP